MFVFPFFPFHPIFWLIPLFLYFLPAFLARHKSNFTAILVLNLLAGWTFIGWIIALVWALSAEPGTRPAATPQQPAASSGFFCSSCGKICAAGAHFCSSCGNPLPAVPR